MICGILFNGGGWRGRAPSLLMVWKLVAVLPQESAVKQQSRPSQVLPQTNNEKILPCKYPKDLESRLSHSVSCLKDILRHTMREQPAENKQERRWDREFTPPNKDQNTRTPSMTPRHSTLYTIIEINLVQSYEPEKPLLIQPGIIPPWGRIYGDVTGIPRLSRRPQHLPRHPSQTWRRVPGSM